MGEDRFSPALSRNCSLGLSEGARLPASVVLLATLREKGGGREKRKNPFNPLSEEAGGFFLPSHGERTLRCEKNNCIY